jgi:hypothetical protein
VIQATFIGAMPATVLLLLPFVERRVEVLRKNAFL